MTSTTIYPCITEAAIANFKPTWLMVKRHKITGLMYFCKTTGKDPIGYTGSGTYWSRHFRKHGKEHIETIWHELFNDIYECVEFALDFSEEADIVASKDWANLKLENGLDGGWGHLKNQAVAGKLGAAAMKEKCKNEDFRQAWIKKISQSECETYKEGREVSGCFASELREEMVKRAITERAKAKRNATYRKIKHQQGENNSQYGTHRIGIFKDDIIKKVLPEQVESYLADGWRLGFKEKVIKEIKPRVSKRRWHNVTCIACGKEFEASPRDMRRGRKFCGLLCFHQRNSVYPALADAVIAGR